MKTMTRAAAGLAVLIAGWCGAAQAAEVSM